MRSNSRLHRIFSALSCLLVASASLPAASRPVAAPASAAVSANDRQSAAPTRKTTPPALGLAHSSSSTLPLVFTLNQGQLDSQVRFSAQWDASSVAFTNNEIIFNLGTSSRKRGEARRGKDSGPFASGPSIATSSLTMKLRGANSAPQVEGLDMAAARSSYFVGNDPRAWRTQVPAYSKIIYRSVYRGIDLLWHGSHGSLEYDFVIAPGSDPQKVEMEFHGTDRVRLSRSGDLLVATDAGELRQLRPVAFQEVNGTRKQVAARYTMKGKHRVGFKVAAYDRSSPLTIDPVLAFSTPMGGDGSFEARVAVDSAGDIYVAGTTRATNLATAGALQRSNHGADAYVVKMDPTGQSVLWATFLGGSYISGGVGTRVGGIAVDGEGQVYIAGTTASPDHPTTPGAFRREKTPNPDCLSIQGCFEGFVTKLNASGSNLVYSTYIGGRAPDQCTAIAVDSQGNAYVAGSTSSPDFPTTPGSVQPVMASIREGINFSSVFVAKLNVAGSALEYSTFLGGYGSSSPTAIAVDGAGSAYIAGSTSAADFPTTAGAFQPQKSPPAPGETYSGTEAFISKLDPHGATLIYSTFLGGPKDDVARGLAIDPEGNAIVTGTTAPGKFPLVNALNVPSGGGRLFGSQNGGGAWTKVDTGLPDAGIRKLTIDPGSASTLYVQTARGPYKSTNGGANWTAINTGFITPVGSYVLSGGGDSILVDKQNSSVLYTVVLTIPDSGDLWKSVDGGQTWSRIYAAGLNDQASNAVGVEMSANSSSTLYIGNGRGVLKSVDGGGSWSYANAGLPPNTEPDDYPWLVNTLVVDPQQASTLYAATTEGLYKTTNGATSWAPTGLAQEVFDLAVDPRASDTLYTYVHPGIISLTDDNGRGHPRRRIHSITPLQGMLKSTDGGESWRAINRGLPDTLNITFITIDPMSTSTLWAGGSEGLYRSDNGGGEWSEVSPPNKYVVSATADPTHASKLYVSSSVSSTGFVAKLNAAGNALIYSTLLGGSQGAQGKAVACDLSGNAYVVGDTRSTDLPVSVAFQSNNRGSSDAFVSKLSPEGALVYSTYLGGRNVDQGEAIAIDASGNAYVVGLTLSTDFPLVHAIEQTPIETASRVFVAKIDPTRDEELPGQAGSPVIVRVDAKGKHVIVTGAGFVGGATVLIDERPQTTVLGGPGQLVGWKAAKRIKPGQTASIQVQNPDGKVSAAFTFHRP